MIARAVIEPLERRTLLSTTVDVTMAFIQPPSNVTDSPNNNDITVMNTPVSVGIYDSDGSLDAGYDLPVSIYTELTSNPNGTNAVQFMPNYAADLTVNAVGGVATFNNVALRLQESGDTYTSQTVYIVAAGEDYDSATDTDYYITNPNAQLQSDTFTVVAGPDALSFVSQPTNSAAGAGIPAFGVELNYANGERDKTNDSAVTLALEGGDGTLSGTSTVTAVDGVAFFSGLSVNTAGTYTLLATSTGASGSATSNQFNIGSNTLTWTGGGDGVNWSDADNWSGSVAPQSGDSLDFTSANSGSLNNDISGLSLNSIDIQGSGYTLGGNNISLTGTLTSESGNNTYDINTTLVGNATIDDQTGDLTLNGTLSGDNLTLAGNGDFTFDDSDNYTGNTTLDSGVTIDDDTLDAFGSGAITIVSGTAPVEVNGSTTPAQIDNNIQFQNGATLDTDPDVTFTGSITVNGAATLAANNSTDAQTLSGATIGGTGTLTVSGSGTININDTIAAGVQLQLVSGAVNLGATLQATGNQVVMSGSAVQLNGVSGTGGIDVKGGILTSGTTGDKNYSGTIVLENAGELDVADPADGNGFGIGTLDLQGGTVLSATVSNTGKALELDNAVTLQGNVSFTLNGAGNDEQNLYLAGVVTANSSSDLTLGGGDALLLNSVAGSQINFEGTGSYLILNGVSAPVAFANNGVDDVGGPLAANSTQSGTIILVNGADTVLQLLTGDGETLSGESVSAVSGAGGIEVMAGTLVSDESTVDSGLPTYSGQITLDADGTLKDYGSSQHNPFGTGTIVLNGGLFQNSSGAVVTLNNPALVQGTVTIAGGTYFEIDGAVTFADPDDTNSTFLTTSGTVVFNDTVDINSSAEAATSNEGDKLQFEGGMQGANTLYLDGPGATFVSGNIAAGATLDVLGTLENGTGFVQLGANLQNALGGPNQVIVDGGVVQLDGTSSVLGPATGTGGIDVKTGTLASDETTTDGGLPDYTGVITVEENGTLKDYGSAVHNPFGTGTIVLNGGLLQNSVAPGVGATISNPVSVQGIVTVVGGTYLDFDGAVTFQNTNNTPPTLTVKGVVVFDNPVTLDSNAETITNATADQIQFQGGISGSGTLTLDGGGITFVAGSVAAEVTLDVQAAFGAGGVQLAAKLQGAANQVIVDGGGVQLDGDNNVLGYVSGAGGIEVLSGVLVTDETAGAYGDLYYDGNISVASGATLKYYDSRDITGFGSGTITFNGGVLQNSSGGIVAIDNVIDIAGAVTFTSDSYRMKLAQNINIESGADLTVVGSLVIEQAVTGSGAITLSGDELAIAGSNPDFTGDVSVTSGNIEVTQNDALGTGSLIETLAGQGVLESVDNIGDPILDNPLTIVSGTLDIEGELTFPAGITVDSGATADVEGSGTAVVVSGPLSGDGTVDVATGASFTTPGGTSGFTGTLQQQGQNLVTPTLTVSDAGGVYTGSPYAATALLSAPGVSPTNSLEGVTPTIDYYVGSSATGTATLTAPSAVGTYTAVAHFAGSTDYNSAQSSPVTFFITAPVISNKLVFTTEPRNSPAGELQQIVVKIENSAGQVLTSDNSTVTLSIASGPGKLSGTITVKAVHGVATFSRLLLTTAGSYTLKATDGIDTVPISRAFTIAPAAPAKIVFAKQPGNARSGASIGTVVVDVEDQYGNLETGFNSFVTLWLWDDSRWGSVFQLASVRAVGGVATFSNVSISDPGSYRLVASANRSLFGTSDSLTISPATPPPSPTCDHRATHQTRAKCFKNR